MVFLLVLIHVVGALFETIDRWDGFSQGGDDIVLTVLSVAICVGFSFLLGILLKRMAVYLAKLVRAYTLTNCSDRVQRFSYPLLAISFLGSPPPLRI